MARTVLSGCVLLLCACAAQKAVEATSARSLWIRGMRGETKFTVRAILCLTGRAGNQMERCSV